MFIRNRSKPLTLQKLDALIPRLTKQHPQIPKLKEDAAKLQKGYNGERRLDYYLRSLTKDYYILNDVGLKIRNQTLQIDSLIITPNSLYLIEVKNFDGTLTFDTVQRQLFQTINQTETTYKYPLTQADNTVYLMMQWLQYHNLPSIPIHSYIALAQPSTMVRVKGDESLISKYVMKTEEIILRIIQTEKEYEKKIESNIQRRNQIVNTIMTHVHDFSIDIFQKYNIDKTSIRIGTRCSDCSEIGMKYNIGKWICQQCGIIKRKAHEESINDFFLLYKNEITIREAMHFLKLKNRYITYRVLKKSKLTYQSNMRAWTKIQAK